MAEWKATAHVWQAHIAPVTGWVVDMGAGNGGFWTLVDPPDRLLLTDIVSYPSTLGSAGLKLVSDVIHPPFKLNSIDCIVALGLIEYFPDLDSLFSILRAISCDKGKLMITNSPPILQNRLRRVADSGVFPRKDDQIKASLEKCGWSVDEIDSIKGGWQSIILAHVVAK